MTRALLLLLCLAPWTAAEEVLRTKLASIIRTQPDSSEARAAFKELVARGAESWPTLAGLVRDLKARHPETAIQAARALANGTEKERREHLGRLYRSSLDGRLRGEILLGLARGYPERAKLLEKACFDKSLPDRLRLFRELTARGLGQERLMEALLDPGLTVDAHIELDRLGVPLKSKDLEVFAASFVRQYAPTQKCRAYAARFAKDPSWTLVDAVARLLKFDDEALRRRAHWILLALSGVDIAPDYDLWRSWIAAKSERYKPPDPVAPGLVAAAVLRGVHFLRKDLLDDGICTYRKMAHPGATALAVAALRASGVKKDDPAITKALNVSILPDEKFAPKNVFPRWQDHTYTIALLIMALEAVDGGTYKNKIQALANRLASGQLRNGQWTYYCGDGYRARAEGAQKFGDNSNTQYALLGLRAAVRAGADVHPDTWMRGMVFWLEVQLPRGYWGYTPPKTKGASLSMTAAGISSLAICLEGLYGRKRAAEMILQSTSLQRGHVAQGRYLLLHGGFHKTHYYGYYGVERACILTGVRKFNDYDWYKEGARLLLRDQRDGGEWISKVRSYGTAVDTAYALLFLKRATTPIVRKQGVINVPS